jgi:hypothetical protein
MAMRFAAGRQGLHRSRDFVLLFTSHQSNAASLVGHLGNVFSQIGNVVCGQLLAAATPPIFAFMDYAAGYCLEGTFRQDI